MYDNSEPPGKPAAPDLDRKLTWRDVPISAVVLVLVLVLAGAAWLVNRGSSAASELAVGDCFAALDFESVQVDRVDDRDCAAPHNGEVFAVFESERLSARSSLQDCDNAFEATEVDLAAIPDDAVIGAFTPTADAWNDGDRIIVCWVFSETGFQRPVVR